MVWSFIDVKKLKKKNTRGEEIKVSEIRKLEKYLKRKRKVTPNVEDPWSKKQLLKSERLLRKLKKEKGMTIEVDQ